MVQICRCPHDRLSAEGCFYDLDADYLWALCVEDVLILTNLFAMNPTLGLTSAFSGGGASTKKEVQAALAEPKPEKKAENKIKRNKAGAPNALHMH